LFSIGIDIGGTFTDCVVVGDAGAVVAMSKAPSSPPGFEGGVLASLEAAAGQLGQTVDELLTATTAVIHGSTVGTNAIVERRGARTGLLTTAGHEDAILIGKAIQKVAGLSERETTNQAELRKPTPLVPRSMIRGVVERIDRDGDVVVPLSDAQVLSVLSELVENGVESVAIAFLWSFVNPIHEIRVRDLCRNAHPDLYVLASHDIAPLIGEYERTATTVLSAYVGPAVTGYLGRLEAQLRAHRFAAQLLVAHAAGGVTTLADIARHPLLTLDSGPASGVVGARYVARSSGTANVICADMGGTTFDVSAIHAGKYLLDEEPVVSQYHYLVPKISVSSIGAGGGSRVWWDDGVVRVGPESAGAVPGPACYGQGGSEATVTDVDLMLGFLNPAGWAGRRKVLDVGLAEASLEQIAKLSGGSTESVAVAAFTIVNAQMADLISRATVQRGHDPREFELYAYGGAAGCHVAYLARELGIRRVYVSQHAGVFSALGMLVGGISHSAERTLRIGIPLTPGDAEQLATATRRLRADMSALFEAEGIPAAEQAYVAEVYVKYTMQPKALAVSLDVWQPEADPEGQGLADAFERAYAELYGPGTGFAEAGFSVVKCSLTGTVETSVREIRAAADGRGRARTSGQNHRRRVVFSEAGTVEECEIVDGSRLGPADVCTGPCVIERLGDTVVVPSFARATVDGFGDLAVDIDC
jgi:N-methylhydantoinase A/oxoprolinase/acetone carboxylase beta subunit